MQKIYFFFVAQKYKPSKNKMHLHSSKGIKINSINSLSQNV